MSIKSNTNKIIEKMVKSKRYFIHRSMNDRLLRGTFDDILYGNNLITIRLKDTIFINNIPPVISKSHCFPLLWIIKIETLHEILQPFNVKLNILPPEIWHYIDEFV